jgi:hypothetical protein
MTVALKRVIVRAVLLDAQPTGACSAVAVCCCSKIAEAEAGVSVNEKKWLVMHVNVQMRLDELRGPPNPWLTVT